MYENETDAGLIELAIRHDRGAFAALFDRHSRAVYLYAWGVTRNDRDAEDVTQDVFVTAWTKLRGIRIAGESARPWLLVTTRNQLSNRGRREARRRHTPFVDDLAAVDSHHEELVWVREEIARLGAIDRRICELCLVEGHSYREAAEQLGLGVNAIAKRVQRIRGRLRSAVGGDE